MIPIIITLGLFAMANAAAIHLFHKAHQTAPARANRPTGAALIYDGARDLSLRSRRFVGQAFDNWTLRFVVVVLIVSAIALTSGVGEFGFLHLTFTNLFAETPESPGLLFDIPLSVVFAMLMVSLACLAGLVLFDGLGSNDPRITAAPSADEGAVVQRRNRHFYLRLAAWNVLIAMALIQLLLGYFRSDELLTAAQLHAQIVGAQAPATETYSTSLRVVTAVLAFLAPLVSAATARYLVTAVTWLVASVLSILLAATLWLPTWILSRIVIRQQRAPVAEPRLQADIPAAVTGRPPDPQPTAERSDADTPDPVAAADRAQETEDRLRDLEEAENRRRERANSNPFGY